MEHDSEEMEMGDDEGYEMDQMDLGQMEEEYENE